MAGDDQSSDDEVTILAPISIDNRYSRDGGPCRAALVNTSRSATTSTTMTLGETEVVLIQNGTSNDQRGDHLTIGSSLSESIDLTGNVSLDYTRRSRRKRRRPSGSSENPVVIGDRIFEDNQGTSSSYLIHSSEWRQTQFQSNDSNHTTASNQSFSPNSQSLPSSLSPLETTVPTLASHGYSYGLRNHGRSTRFRRRFLPRTRRAGTSESMALMQTTRDFTAEDYETLLQLDRALSHRRGLSKDRIDDACLIIKLEKLPEDSTCSICLEPYTLRQKIAIIRKCAHKFHSRCCTRWLRQKNSCPICQGKALD